jgi:hypothetical protein
VANDATTTEEVAPIDVLSRIDLPQYSRYIKLLVRAMDRFSDCSATKIAAISVHYYNIKGGGGLVGMIHPYKYIILETIEIILY